jgi:hypothetical protein
MSARGLKGMSGQSPAQELAAVLVDALQNFIHPDAHGQYPRPVSSRNRAQYTDDFFIYPISIGSLAAGAVFNGNIQIQADSDFEWIESTCFGWMDTATAPFTDGTIMPVNIQIVDSGSGRQLFNAPTPINSFAGTGKQPFILPVPRKFMARSTINIFATNADPTNKYDDIFLNFIGRKIFKFGPGHEQR